MKVYILENNWGIKEGGIRTRAFASESSMLKAFQENLIKRNESYLNKFGKHICCRTEKEHLNLLGWEVNSIVVVMVDKNGKEEELPDWGENYQVLEVEG